jgi:hypothetical protein
MEWSNSNASAGSWLMAHGDGAQDFKRMSNGLKECIVSIFFSIIIRVATGSQAPVM